RSAQAWFPRFGFRVMVSALWFPRYGFRVMVSALTDCPRMPNRRPHDRVPAGPFAGHLPDSAQVLAIVLGPRTFPGDDAIRRRLSAARLAHLGRTDSGRQPRDSV